MTENLMLLENSSNKYRNIDMMYKLNSIQQFLCINMQEQRNSKKPVF